MADTATENGTNSPSEETEGLTFVNMVFLEGEPREATTCFIPGGNTAGVLSALYGEDATPDDVDLSDFEDLRLDPDATEVCTPVYEVVDDLMYVAAFPYSNVIGGEAAVLGPALVLELHVQECGGEGSECCEDGTCVEGLVCDDGICSVFGFAGCRRPRLRWTRRRARELSSCR